MLDTQRPAQQGHHRTKPMEPTIDRSVWGTSTDDFKRHFREYLRDLAILMTNTAAT